MGTEALNSIQTNIPNFSSPDNRIREKFVPPSEDAQPTEASSRNNETEADGAEISDEAQALSEEENEKPSATDDPQELSDSEKVQVRELKSRDTEVRAHEAAHKRAAGSHARGGPNYEYQQGPDGKRYAVGGHVNIDISKVDGDPRATIAKAEQVKRAALAPAEPSTKDRQVAAKADSIRAEAQKELSAEQLESFETSGKEEDSGPKETAESDQGSAEPIAIPGNEKDRTPGLEPVDFEPPPNFFTKSQYGAKEESGAKFSLLA